MPKFLPCWLVAAAFFCRADIIALAEEPATLKAAFGDRFAIGVAIPDPNLSPGEEKLSLDNFSNITPEECMKPKPIEPEEGKFTFERADALVDFAGAHGLKVNGHTLVWHEDCPDWFFLGHGKTAGRKVVLQRLRNHIATEVGHFRGKVYSWDVVNEAIGDGPEYLRNSRWLAGIGPDYITDAFLAAHEADPDAQLYYNDYNLEKPEKLAKALRLIHTLKAANAHLDGIGIQGHWELDKIPFQDIENAIAAFHDEGLKVMITELDIDMAPRRSHGQNGGPQSDGDADPYARGIPPEMLARQAAQYGRLFALFVKHADEITRVTFWGLHDGRSWLNDWPSKRTNYPLLWNRNLQPKPAFFTVIDASKG